MATETKIPFDETYIRTFSSGRGEPDWLTERRLEALRLSERLPLPKPEKTKIDKWNFTGFSRHVVDSAPYDGLDDLPEAVKALIEAGEGTKNLYVQRNHTPAYVSLSDELKEKGVIFTDIFTAAREHGDLLKHYLMTAVKPDEHHLAALHAALFNGGVFVYVPKNVEIETPLQAVYIQDEDDIALFNHVIIVAEDNSRVVFVENYLSAHEQGKAAVNIVAEVFANANARVFFAAVDHLAKGTTTYVNRRGIAGRDGRIEWALGLMNDGNTVSENITRLVGDGSFGDTKTVAVSRGEQVQNFTTSVVHYGKHTEGTILKHGVVRDSATSIFNGIGKIEHGASKSNAEQESRVLMLSEKARGDANPILLIDEDDVMAGHAASVGRVDPIQLYYLMSRGIPRRDAERLIIHGFLAPVVEAIPLEGVKNQLIEVIERKVQS
ncbi:MULTISPECIES: Fe-S cluster assembly protein SufD [Geobacillus]|uniref:Fe-S cluster assembly protein SufD n=1 Tax=Geobacillus thermocatenulatus TaxID=33938 RepID=A0A226QBN5_9BACL|nr:MULTISPECIES: Fe-S cluster assembly protein SufD [Geobacillus]ASS98316.1 Fe-S cluster assembly protein SufD [Geobacillus thermocatenulatus]KLR74288.1 Fe-S cluster assembly protein SufD [Geobacillus sp. T6]OXB89077.1 Fe-S cluster assembly protein SufD [Geobacillus thermocatenulatus]RAN22342.1 Fe-S cluster assembly protein SufD [Geobacillus sp. A8]